MKNKAKEVTRTRAYAMKPHRDARDKIELFQLIRRKVYAGHKFVIRPYCSQSSLRLSSTFESDRFIFAT